MSHPSYNGRIGEPFIELFTIDSTNNYAMGKAHEGLASHGTVYITEHQTAGKGQRSKSWTANPGENITMSIVLEPSGPNIARPFLLSAAIALACRDFFNDYTMGDVSIKWPNDIYWRDRKAGGILIENIYRASKWQYAIAGIGLNLNQSTFPSNLPNPVSLKQITGKEHNRVQLAKELSARLEVHYQRFLEPVQSIMPDYNAALYKRHSTVRLRQENIIFETIIDEVTVNGQLLTHDTIPRSFSHGEIEWVF